MTLKTTLKYILITLVMMPFIIPIIIVAYAVNKLKKYDWYRDVYYKITKNEL